MRSYDSAITARTPGGSLGSPSRGQAEPYSLPAITIVGTFSVR
jgi:hypothetical protein